MTRAAAVAVVLVAALLSRPGLFALQRPVFRSGVELVTVDVTVLNQRGEPYEGLTAEQFDVTVDGTPRRVVWSEFVRHRPAPLAAAASGDHFSTNEGAQPGRFVLIAVDQMHIRRAEGLAALRAASSFVDALDRSDRVAAVRLNDGAPIQFTTEHVTVKRQLQRFTGEANAMPVHFRIGLTESLAIADGSRTVLDQVVLRECGQPLGRYENLGRIAESGGMRDPCPVQVEQEGRGLAQQARTEARLTLDALARLLVRLAEIEGPKTLVLLSEGLVAEPRLIDLTALGAAAQAARVTLHVLQLEAPILDASNDTVSPTLFPDRQLQADGLARLAGSARGGLFRLVGADPYPFKRIMTELSSHYLVAFEPIPDDRDGQTHRINLRVRAHGAQVRTHPAFRIPSVTNAPAADAELVHLLRNQRIATDLPMRVAAYAFKAPDGDRLHVMISGEADRGAGAPELTAGFVLVDSRGVIAASGGTLTEAGRFWHTATVPAGRYTLKAAAVDGTGRRGSVERHFDVKLMASGGAQFSDLMLAPPAPASAPLRPLVLRAATDSVMAYLEVYIPKDWQASTARAVADIEREDLKESRSVPATIEAGAGRWIVRAHLPMKDLTPGAHTVTMTLTLPGIPDQRIARRFVVSP